MLRKLAVAVLTAQILFTGQPVWASCDSLLRTWVSIFFPYSVPSKPFSDAQIESALRALADLGIQPKEGHGPPERWKKDGPGAYAYYAKDFCAVVRLTGGNCSRLFFAAWLRARHENGLGAHVLDLMGSGFFLTPAAPTDSVTGLRWGPYRPKSEERGLKIPVEILGDILNPLTWDALDESMRAREIPAMDLITLRPDGGWEQAPWHSTPEGNIQALRLILAQTLKRLSTTGRFYFEIPLYGIRGNFARYPSVQALIQEIESRTPYHLLLSTSESDLGNTLKVSGALIPK